MIAVLHAEVQREKHYRLLNHSVEIKKKMHIRVCVFIYLYSLVRKSEERRVKLLALQ